MLRSQILWGVRFLMSEEPLYGGDEIEVHTPSSGDTTPCYNPV